MNAFVKMRGVMGMQQVNLPPDVRTALENWQALPPEEEGKPHFFTRYVSVDVATAGLRPGVDALLSVAAVGVHQGALGDDVMAFDVPPPGAAGHDTIARHLVGLLLYLGKAPLVTYQAAFVDAFLRRAFEEHLGIDFSPAWIDLAWVLPELFASATHGRMTLDDWLHHFDINLPGRQEALSDALAVGRLLLAAEVEAARRGINTPKKLREIEPTRRWLGREN
ncbi:MAG: 3'-5' exonuclease [Betaproteobacteria bacterium]